MSLTTKKREAVEIAVAAVKEASKAAIEAKDEAEKAYEAAGAARSLAHRAWTRAENALLHLNLLLQADDAERARKTVVDCATTALHDALHPFKSVEGLREALAAYEATGDHDHGKGPIKPGGRCPGGDCMVAQARAILADRASRGAS